MTWTAQQISVVRLHWGKGKNAREIGELIDMSRNAVIGKAHRLGLYVLSRNDRPTEPRRKPLRRVRKARLTRSESPSMDECTWLEGEPRERNFCRAPVVKGSSWCAEHYAKCHVPPGEYRRDEYRRKAA